MNKPLLFGFIGFVVVILGLPLLAQIMKDDSAAAPAGASGSASAPPPPVASGPPLDATTLTGTTWEVNTDRGPVTASFSSGGVLNARHMLAGNISGTWQVSGNAVTLNATALGQQITINLQISGNTLLYEGQPARRVS